MGGRPSKGTPADKRLKGNGSSKPTPKPSAPKFGTPAWKKLHGGK